MEECPMCGSVQVSFSNEKETFEYGVGEDAVKLEAIVKVGHCRECNFTYTGDDADEVREKAVAEYLAKK